MSFTPSLKGKNETHLKYAVHCSCLVSDYTILLSLYHSMHVSSSHYKNVFTIQSHTWEYWRQVSSLLHYIYKIYAMATYHRGAGCPLDRGINLNAEDPEPTDIDKSTHSSDAIVALGGLETAGYPEHPAYSSHDKLMALIREINDLHQ